MSGSLVVGHDGLARCWWCGNDPAYVAYHDHEWGRPVADDQALFEKLSLDAFQAGLSWVTILHKRPGFRDAFDAFHPPTVAAYDDAAVERLMRNDAIVRNRAKIEATIANAGATVQLAEDGGSLSELVWAFAPEPGPAPRTVDEVPASTAASAALAKRLKAAGFRFVGPTMVYAFMQAVGVINDHLADCHRRGAAGLA
jgi:DNA-3-methyladenine glycosylase I